MQELDFDKENNGQNTGFISLDPADKNYSPDIDSPYSYLLGWKLFNQDQSIQRALITNIANEKKVVRFDNTTGFINNNFRCIKITSRDENNIPSIGQYINGDSDLHFDTTYTYFPYYIDKEFDIPAYSVVLLEEIPPSSNPIDYYNLHSVYPNPFNSVAKIQYELSKTNFISINVYDLKARLVKKLYNGKQTSGYHEVYWNANDVASGVYIVHMQVDDRFETSIISLIK